MEISPKLIEEVFGEFDHNTEFVGYTELTSGHINDTFKVAGKNHVNFVLQRINSYVFKLSKELIINKVKVSDHIQNKLSHFSEEELMKKVLRFLRTKKGLPYYKDKDGNFWNMTYYIEGSITHERVTDGKIAFEGGKLFGEFLNLTQGLNIDEIVDIIPNFHEMSFRYSQFYEALKSAKEDRLVLAKEAIAMVHDLKEEMHLLESLKNEGKIPLCITHNDTKISNALFDMNNNGLCVIDTDTVMVGIVHNSSISSRRSILYID